jgi:hypothetical protein
MFILTLPTSTAVGKVSIMTAKRPSSRQTLPFLPLSSVPADSDRQRRRVTGILSAPERTQRFQHPPAAQSICRSLGITVKKSISLINKYPQSDGRLSLIEKSHRCHWMNRRPRIAFTSFSEKFLRGHDLILSVNLFADINLICLVICLIIS